MVRQNKPENNSSSMFEIFNRLNTGGAALTPQEVRASLFIFPSTVLLLKNLSLHTAKNTLSNKDLEASVYYCPFYTMISRLNLMDSWRNILNKTSIDLHSNDIELILRSIALLIDEQNYFPKMTLFLRSIFTSLYSFT